MGQERIMPERIVQAGIEDKYKQRWIFCPARQQWPAEHRVNSRKI